MRRACTCLHQVLCVYIIASILVFCFLMGLLSVQMSGSLMLVPSRGVFSFGLFI